MDVKIYSLDAIKAALYCGELRDYFVLSIRDTAVIGSFYQRVDKAPSLSLCRGLVAVEMDDIKEPHDLLQVPTKAEVAKTLSSCKRFDKIAVHCSAGVSRSSAFAYLLACQAEGPEKAITYLNENLHWPNSLIVSLGSSILENPEIAKTCAKWKRKSGSIIRRPSRAPTA